MKLNIAYPTKGTQKMYTIDNLTAMKLYGMRLRQQFNGDLIGNGFEGYIFKITGGDDESGRPMKTGILSDKKVRLLLGGNTSGYRQREKGVRKRKTVRGSIIANDIAVLSLIILQEGTNPLPGLTDKVIPCSHLPKRAKALREMFNIPEGENIKKFIKNLIYEKAEDKTKIKFPTIKPTREDNSKYLLLKQQRKENKEARRAKTMALEKEYREKYL
ncbi:hypothetical protein H312_01338 [Anncaliia algerae PRA339]|uniref:40S ribosomal protein S6 n=1 Tax=Anncaliia algerae PRA339 TaxID=1288291 RepID=A0A059F238_9MICR|nr:hypothetical protein H312_01338 [Anncaliia algerae PRA339]